MLTATQVRKLEPLLNRKSARQRLLLYLLADGMSPEDILAMDVVRLRKTNINNDFDVVVEQVLLEVPDGLIFVFPGGQPLSLKRVLHVLHTTTKRHLNKSLTISEFGKYIRKA